MKKLRFLSLILTLTIACANQPSGLVYTTLLVDLTREDMELDTVDTSSISKWLLPVENADAALFEMGYISDLHQSSLEHSRLTSSNFLVNDLQRKSERNAFVNETVALLQKARTKQGGREQSIILWQVAQTINRQTAYLACTERYIYVLSDFMEHSDYLSFYEDTALDFYETQPDSLYRLLDLKFPLQSIEDKNIHLAMIYQPSNKVEDQRFYRISRLLVPYYTSKGISTEVFPNLKQAITYTNIP